MTSSVIIVSYRPGDWLCPSVASVVDQSDEVIVVDNDSPQGEATRIAERLGAKSVRAKSNLGFAGGVNLGLKYATGDLVGLLNDDAVAGENWLVAAADVLAQPDVAAVTPKVLLQTTFAEVRVDRPPTMVRSGATDITAETFAGSDRLYVPLLDSAAGAVFIDDEPVALGAQVRLLNHAGVYLHRRGFAGDFGLGAPDNGGFDKREERFACSGAAVVFRADTLARIGRFPARYFAYYEDIDWCFRARLAGMRIVYDPGATVTHRMSATSAGDRRGATRRLTRRNQLLTLVRNAPVPVVAEHLARATLSPHLRGVRAAVGRQLTWAVKSRQQLKRGWIRSPGDVWREWAGVDEEWESQTTWVRRAK
jgi:GT2 family glycosyltransferase